MTQTAALAFAFDPIQILMIIGIAILSTSFSQFLSWFMLYRKQSYINNKNQIQKLNKKLEKLKNTHVAEARDKTHSKKVQTTEAQLKSLSQQMTFQSMKSNVLVGIVMIGVINFMGTYFQGVVVAMLPFEPFSLLRGISHRNIQGQNFYQSSYLFIYIIFAFIIRSNIKKIFGFEPPKAAVSYFDPPKYKPE